MRIQIICPDCGSDNVGHDATVRWNIDTQEYEVAGIFDNAWCDDCGYDDNCGLEEVDLDALPDAAAARAKPEAERTPAEKYVLLKEAGHE